MHSCRLLIALFLMALSTSFVGRAVSAPSTNMTTSTRYQFVSWPQWGYLIEEQSPLAEMQCVGPWIPANCSGYWVINPEPGTVLWNIDDLEGWTAVGSLDAGQSYSIIERTIVDSRFHMLYVSGNVGQNRTYRLAVSVPEWGASYSQDFTGFGSFCVWTPWSGLSDSRFSDILGSKGGNGQGPFGRGLQAHFVFTITIIDSRNANNVALSPDVLYPTAENMQAYCGGTNHTPVGNGFELVGP